MSQRQPIPDVASQRAELLEGLMLLFDGSARLPGAGPLRQETLRRLSETLDQLPANCKEALICSRVRGMTHSEIAARLGIPRTEVEVCLVRALMKCRTCFVVQPK